MKLISAVTGEPLQIQGFAAVLGSQSECADGIYRVAPRCDFRRAGDVVLTFNHMSESVRLAWTGDRSLRLWNTDAGLCFSADVTTERWWPFIMGMFNKPTLGCSFLGPSDLARVAGGVTEYRAVDIEDVCIADAPRFPEAACWRSDTSIWDLSQHVRGLHNAFHQGRRRELVDARFPISTVAAAALAPRPMARRRASAWTAAPVAAANLVNLAAELAEMNARNAERGPRLATVLRRAFNTSRAA